MAHREFDQEQHAQASKRVMETLEEILTEEVLPDGGIVVSAITVVETMSNEGESRTFTLFTDNRVTMLLGLLQVGGMHIAGGMGGGPAS